MKDFIINYFNQDKGTIFVEKDGIELEVEVPIIDNNYLYDDYLSQVIEIAFITKQAREAQVKKVTNIDDFNNYLSRYTSRSIKNPRKDIVTIYSNVISDTSNHLAKSLGYRNSQDILQYTQNTENVEEYTIAQEFLVWLNSCRKVFDSNLHNIQVLGESPPSVEDFVNSLPKFIRQDKDIPITIVKELPTNTVSDGS